MTTLFPDAELQQPRRKRDRLTAGNEAWIKARARVLVELRGLDPWAAREKAIAEIADYLADLTGRTK